MIVSFDLSESSNKLLELLLDGPATSEHMLALLPFKFPASRKYAILNLFVTTTTTMHVEVQKRCFMSLCIRSIVVVSFTHTPTQGCQHAFANCSLLCEVLLIIFN